MTVLVVVQTLFTSVLLTSTLRGLASLCQELTQTSRRFRRAVKQADDGLEKLIPVLKTVSGWASEATGHSDSVRDSVRKVEEKDRPEPGQIAGRRPGSGLPDEQGPESNLHGNLSHPSHHHGADPADFGSDPGRPVDCREVVRPETATGRRLHRGRRYLYLTAGPDPGEGSGRGRRLATRRIPRTLPKNGGNDHSCNDVRSEQANSGRREKITVPFSRPLPGGRLGPTRAGNQSTAGEASGQ